MFTHQLESTWLLIPTVHDAPIKNNPRPLVKVLHLSNAIMDFSQTFRLCMWMLLMQHILQILLKQLILWRKCPPSPIT